MDHRGTKVNVDELDENITQLDPPSVASDGTGIQSPPSVRRHSQSQLIPTQSAPSVVQKYFLFDSIIISGTDIDVSNVTLMLPRL